MGYFSNSLGIKNILEISKKFSAKHGFIKFEYLMTKMNIFLRTERYTKNKTKIYKKIYKKIDLQTFLNIKLKQSKSLKESIPYSQALRIGKNLFEDRVLSVSLGIT